MKNPFIKQLGHLAVSKVLEAADVASGYVVTVEALVALAVAMVVVLMMAVAWWCGDGRSRRRCVCGGACGGAPCETWAPSRSFGCHTGLGFGRRAELRLRWSPR
jgi:hypothetical protein